MEDSFALVQYAFYTALLVSILGFIRTVWFISIGYANSILVLCLLLTGFHYNEFHVYNTIQVVILGLWALRLSVFLIRREFNTNYAKAVSSQTSASQAQPIYIKIAIWIGVSILYALMFSPAIFSLQEAVHFGDYFTIIAYLGVAIMVVGFLIETIADKQKSNFKNEQPDAFCNVGLYRWVRCPNYLGEIIVWTGSLITCLSFLNAWWQWAMALTGWVCIVLIMIGSTKRLEEKHKSRYGGDPKFEEYIHSVPILFPGLPIYSFENVKIYLG